MGKDIQVCFGLPGQDFQWRGKRNLFLNGKRERDREPGSQSLPSWRGGSRKGLPAATTRAQPGRREIARVWGAHCPSASVPSLKEARNRERPRASLRRLGLRRASPASGETPALRSGPRGRGAEGRRRLSPPETLPPRV